MEIPSQQQIKKLTDINRKRTLISLTKEEFNTKYFAVVLNIIKRIHCSKEESTVITQEGSIGNYNISTIIKGYNTDYILTEIFISRDSTVYKIIIDEDISNGYKIYTKNNLDPTFKIDPKITCDISQDGDIKVKIIDNREVLIFSIYSIDYHIAKLDINVIYN